MDRETYNKILEEVNSIQSLSDSVKWLFLCKHILRQITRVSLREEWVKDEVVSIIGEIAKLILEIRNKLDKS